MATSDFWQRLSGTISPADQGLGLAAGEVRSELGTVALSMIADALTVLIAVTVATQYRLHVGLQNGAGAFVHGTLIHGRSMNVLLSIVGGYAIALVYTSRRLNLYSHLRYRGILNEQRLSMQASFTAGLLLTGFLYLLHANDIPRSIVMLTIVLVTVGLGARRLVRRTLAYRRFDRGMDTRDVLIVGTGPEAHALRHHIESVRRLGYKFKGFVQFSREDGGVSATESEDVVGTIETVFQHARKHFVDEIFFTAPADRTVVRDVLQKARIYGVDLRVVPELYDGAAWNSPIEYVGHFPTIPLYRGRVKEASFVLKRVIDILFAGAVLIALLPFLLVIALAIRLDTHGPVFYASERIGKKGRVFRCFKFRTMVPDAECLRAELESLNERDGVLFKIRHDPRVTAVGRLLRKFSLDELPQFINVLRGEMSVVGPRPPIASEVREYNLSHLRRLSVMPGITGLWQVQGRQDPSFDSYVSLDVTYIENWSIWMDVKIIVRTIGVVLSGTGT
ncbi:MAG TPA: sugar transferase [Terracidiphilus sp.]|nr:sugar transferase [Terracidiphilus sp.]